jgi:hypothetical protein
MTEQPDGITATVTATTYTITCLPGDVADGHHWDLEVQFTGAHRFGKPRPANRQWAVRMRDHWCLSNEGKWDMESIPSERTDEWFETHRFDLETALKLAAEQAPHVIINGLTPVGLLAWRKQRHTERQLP